MCRGVVAYEDSLSAELAARVLRRFGFEEPPTPDLVGLNALYLTWCRRVPFDNLRKLLALREGDRSGELPGARANDFFEHWLETGTGATCWPSSNALFMLLHHCGFDVRRVSASMMDMDQPNHGSVIAHVGDGDYLVDSSILSNRVLPLIPGRGSNNSDAVYPVRVEPVGASFRVWFSARGPDPMPCRLLGDGVSFAFYLERYELTRASSPFNGSLYARRNFEGGVRLFSGAQRREISDSSTTVEELALEALIWRVSEEVGIAASVVRQVVSHDQRPSPEESTG
jgi:hypothetical protein